MLDKKEVELKDDLDKSKIDEQPLRSSFNTTIDEESNHDEDSSLNTFDKKSTFNNNSNTE